MILPLLALSLLAHADDSIPVKLPARASAVSYAREVAEILDGKCNGCHGPTLANGKLKLDSGAAMLKGGKHGPAVVAGKADESLLFKMAAHRVEPFMPPKDKPDQAPLTPEELGVIKLWIDAGAKDDTAEMAAAAKPIELGALPPGVHPINAVDMTAGGSLVASGRGNVVEIHDADSGLLVTTLGGHKDLIQSLRFRPDGRALAAGSFQVVTRWTLPKTGEAKTLEGHQSPVRAVVASADGRTLYSAGDDLVIQVWDVESGKSARTIPAPAGAITALALSPDGKLLAAGGADGLSRVIQVADGVHRLALKGHEGPITGVAFVDHGKRLATAGRDGSARVWTLPEASAKEAAEPLVLRGHAGPIVALATSVDGTSLATGGEDGTVRLWHPEDGRARGAITSPGGPVRGLSLSPDGTLFAVGSDKGTVSLFDVGGEPRGVLSGLKAAVSSIVFAPRGDRLATATAGGGVKVWDAATKGGIAAFGHLGPDRNVLPPAIHAVTFLSDGALATASAAKTVKVWTCEGTWGESSPLGPHAYRVLALDYSPDGTLIAAGGGEPSRSGEVKIWNADDGSLVRTLPELLHSDTVFGVAFSPDGKSLASCAADRFMKVTNVADGKEIKSFEGHTGHVLSVDWSADGKQLATGGADNVVKVWEFESGDQLRTLQAAGKQVTSVRWSRGAGAAVVAGSSGDKVVRFWNPANGSIPRTFGGSGDYLFAVAISSDQKRVAAGGAEGVLFLWNGQNGQILRKIEP